MTKEEFEALKVGDKIIVLVPNGTEIRPGTELTIERLIKGKVGRSSEMCVRFKEPFNPGDEGRGQNLLNKDYRKLEADGWYFNREHLELCWIEKMMREMEEDNIESSKNRGP